MIRGLPAEFRQYSNTLCLKSKFMRFGHTNAYVYNNVLCSFSLKRHNDKTFTLEFGVRPLCDNIFGVWIGDYTIDQLSSDQYVGALDMAGLVPYITEELVPFFEKAENTKRAQEALIQIITKMNDARLSCLSKENIEDCGWPIEKQIYNTSSVFFCAMKSLDFETMEKCLSYKIPFWEDIIEGLYRDYLRYRCSDQNRRYADLMLVKMQKAKKEKEYYERVLAHVRGRDTKFFQDEVNRREQISRTNLPQRIWSTS